MHNFLLVLTAIVSATLTGSRAAVTSKRVCVNEPHTGRLRLWQPFTPGGELQRTNAHVTGGTSPGDDFTWTTPLTGHTFHFSGCPIDPTFTLLCTTCDNQNDRAIVVNVTSARTEWTLINGGMNDPTQPLNIGLNPWDWYCIDWVYDGTFVIPVIDDPNYEFGQDNFYATMNDAGNFVFSADAVNQFPYFAFEFEEDS